MRSCPVKQKVGGVIHNCALEEGHAPGTHAWVAPGQMVATADITHLRNAEIDALRDILRAAPNPRVVGGAPAYWSWYDGPRAQALKD